MNMKTLIAVGGIALSAALALAPTPASAEDFTGPRIEAHAGWDRLGVDSTAFKVDDEKDGIVYGVGIGYDVAVSPTVVAGLEAEFNLSDVDLRSVAGTTTATVEAKRDISVSGRIGAKLAENVLVYAKAGYSNARLKGVITTGGTTGPTTTEVSGNGDGLRVGGGVEFALGGGAYAKAEYRYSDYEGGVTRHQAVTGFGFRF
jgi:outer membrane immunogenic protein